MELEIPQPALHNQVYWKFIIFIDHTYCYTHTLLNPENDFYDGHEICFSPMDADLYNEKDCHKVISQQTKIFRQGQLFYWSNFLSQCKQNSTHILKELLNSSRCSLFFPILNSKFQIQTFVRFLNWSELALNADPTKWWFQMLELEEQ